MAEMTGEARVPSGHPDRARPRKRWKASGTGETLPRPEHILLGLLDEEESLGGGALAGLGITKERARDWLVPVLEQMAAAKGR